MTLEQALRKLGLLETYPGEFRVVKAFCEDCMRDQLIAVPFESEVGSCIYCGGKCHEEQ